MTISFASIPSNLRIPFVAVEFDASLATQGPSILAYSALIIGQKLTTGTATANTFVRVANVDQTIIAGGRGSMLHRQAIAWFANNRSTEVWLGVLDDAGAGVAATGTIVVAGPATKAGTLALYLGGERVTVGVNSGDASTAIATAIAAAVNANLDLPVTATVATSTVTLTYRHKGLAGNSYDVRANYRDGEALPAGVTLTITALGSVVAGTTNPTLTTLIANMNEQWWQIWTHPYTDATSLTAIETELISRAGPLRQIDGVAISAAAGSFSTLSTLGSGRNVQYSTIFSEPGINPLTPPMEAAAASAAQVAASAANDPAKPFQTLPLAGVLPPATIDLFDNTERDLLLRDGISTTKVTGGVVKLERAITTYQTSPAGADDTAYLDVTTVLTLLYLRYDWRQRIATKYSRHKLANDGTQFGSGQDVMTPQLGKVEALNWYREKMEQGLVENFELFKANLLVERDASDPNRMNWLLPPDLINQLIVSATKMQFRV